MSTAGGAFLAGGNYATRRIALKAHQFLCVPVDVKEADVHRLKQASEVQMQELKLS